MGWLSVHMMSAAASTPSPCRSARSRARLSTIARWLAWKSCLIRAHSSPISGSPGAAAWITSMIAAARSLTIRELRAESRSRRSGSGSSITLRNQSCSPTGTSSRSPRSARCQTARSTPAFVSKVRYTVFSATPAAAAIAATDVAA